MTRSSWLSDAHIFAAIFATINAKDSLLLQSDFVQPHFCVTAAHVILKSLGWRFCSMAKIVFGMNVSLDGYVDHEKFAPGPQALSSLDRARARPDRQCVRPPHVRDHALLGRRPSGVECGATRVRGGVAAPTEVGRVALAEVSRPQRHACRRMTSRR